MSRGKRYKQSESRLKKFLLFYIVLTILVVVNYTFSRYTATSESTTTINTAKFNIQVNDKNVNQAENFSLMLSPTENTFNNKIAPDSEGYFEIEIDPTRL